MASLPHFCQTLNQNRRRKVIIGGHYICAAGLYVRAVGA